MHVLLTTFSEGVIVWTTAKFLDVDPMNILYHLLVRPIAIERYRLGYITPLQQKL